MGKTIIFLNLCMFPLILSETHWLVTENGRIQSLTESLFHMAQPHNFVQFLKQEERVRRAEDAKQRLTNQKSVIRHHEQNDDPQLEARIMESDSDCIIAGKPLAQQNLFISTVVPLAPFGIKYADRIGEVRKVPRNIKVPYCTNGSKLLFSMSAFEHLEGVRERVNLSSAPDPDLLSVAFEEWNNASDFAHAVAMALQEKGDDWLIYTMASYYFRYIGDSVEAIECLRRALHLSPREFAVIPLLSLANILHQGSRSVDAAVVLDTALIYNNSIGQIYLTAGHAYAVSLQYEKALEALEKAARLSPNYSIAKQHQAAVRCHQKLELALEAQHQNLEKTLTELKSYQVRLKNFQTLNEDVLRYVIDSETRQLSGLTYDHVVYGPLEGLSCFTDPTNGQQFIDCDIDNFVLYKSSKRRKMEEKIHKHQNSNVSVPKEITDRNPVAQNSIASPLNATVNATFHFKEQKLYLASLEVYRNLASSIPTIPKRYPLSNTSNVPVAEYAWLDDSWPPPNECSTTMQLPRSDNVPSLFLSPENKGFNVKEILTKYLNLNDTYGHPLPWYPPFCSSDLQSRPDVHLDCCDHLLGVQRARTREKERMLPEPGLRQIIMSFMPSSYSEAEFGQRILTLLNLNIVSKWISYNLAALYWRVTGVSAETTACLRLALAESDDRYSDVSLVQLSQLAFNAGNRLDDAMNLLHQALEIDDQEPVTHYLLARYLILKDNFTGAIWHLRKCLLLDQRFADAFDLFKWLRCSLKHVQLYEVAKPKIEKPPLSQCSKKDKGPRFFCLKEDGDERCYLEERMLPGASVQSDVVMCPACNMPHCLKPPPLASMFLSMFDKKNRFRGKHSKAKTSVKSTAAHNAALNDQDENEPELSLIDASMQPGTSKMMPKKTEANSNKPDMFEQLQAALLPKIEEEEAKLSPPVAKKSTMLSLADIDTSLPEILPLPPLHMARAGAALVALPKTTTECTLIKNRVRIDQPISNLLAISAKDIRVEDFVDFVTSPEVAMEPFCPMESPSSMWTMDHLQGYVHRNNLTFYKPERGLKDAFQSIGYKKESIEIMASRIASAMKANEETPNDDSVWILATIAALYWRVKGNGAMAIACSRQAMNNAPYAMKDLALISLANIYHQSGFLHSALIVASAALNVSPKYVVVHFTLANVYASLGDMDRAMLFYYSALSLQKSLDAAKDRIRAIHCITGLTPKQLLQ